MEAQHMMKKRMILLVPAAILGIILFVIIGGALVTHLWNWLLPGLFGWRALTFWQGIGLLALCRILFGGLGMRRAPGSTLRRRMGWRWERMTSEEREKLRQRFRERCGSFVQPEAKPSPGV
jgi:MFS family permease